MTGSFFSAEAHECTAELAQLLAAGAPPAALRVSARRLRGSAQMASRDACIRAARAIERALRAAESGGIPWDADTRGALTAAVQGVEALIESDSEKGAEAVEQAVRDLCGAEGDPSDAFGSAPGDGARTEDQAAFLRGEVERVREALQEVADAAGRDAPDASALHRLLDAQAVLSGSARLAHAPVVARVVEAADHLARTAISGGAGAASRAEKFSSLAGVLADPRAQGRALPQDLEQRIEAARSVGEEAREGEIPVEVANFFRSEAAADFARAEQLARDAAQGRTATAADRLISLLEALATTATTFGFAAVAERLGEANKRLAAVARATLPAEVSALSRRVMSMLGEPPQGGLPGSAAGLDSPGPARPAAPIVTAGAGDDDADRDPPALPEPGPAEVHAGVPTDSEPAVPAAGTAVPAPDADGAVPIAALCYAGAAALERAASLRAAWRTSDGAEAREIVEEMFDLIDLARRS